MGEWIDCSYFQKIQAGRRCSCWGNNDSPSGECRVCYQTGVVGGWEKRGTAQWLLDSTTSNLEMTNCIPLVSKQGPVLFGLADEALQGELFAVGSFEGCYGPVDMLESLHWDGGGLIRHDIKTPATNAWIPITRENIQNLFSTPQIFDVRIRLSRPSLSAETPLFGKLHLRILRTPTAATSIRANKPRSQHSLALSELGILDEWTSERWWVDSTLSNLTSEDWFYDQTRDMRWKVVDVDKMAPQAYLLSWDLSVRKIQNFESMYQFPL